MPVTSVLSLGMITCLLEPLIQPKGTNWGLDSSIFAWTAIRSCCLGRKSPVADLRSHRERDCDLHCNTGIQINTSPALRWCGERHLKAGKGFRTQASMKSGLYFINQRFGHQATLTQSTLKDLWYVVSWCRVSVLLEPLCHGPVSSIQSPTTSLLRIQSSEVYIWRKQTIIAWQLRF